ncbi:unnamed protein product [Microthlaspi erraticum]|uniref:Retrotransposon gag domain-containing protein n=1 Tax=Microthlaspi erraticum TaxID=1685480 RepID=A0A6D2IKL2_9BRAS|nr:unnamed protein product [Microthlaspi erraticum]
MDGAPRGRGARGRGARGRGGRVGRGGRAGGRAGRGRGRGLPEESGESVAPSVHTASVTQSVPLAGDASASVGLGAGAAPGGGGAPAPGRDDLVVGLLTQLLARFPPVVPQGAPGVPPVAEVQHVAADVAQPEAVDAGVTRYLEFMGHMQRIGTPFFEGRVGPEEADAWRQRVERNFHSIRCPIEYWVELAVHYLSGDAHLWWQAAVGDVESGFTKL